MRDLQPRQRQLGYDRLARKRTKTNRFACRFDSRRRRKLTYDCAGCSTLGDEMNQIRSRVPAAEYHALPGISITRLKELKRSALHYQYRLDHPAVTVPLTLGTASHCAVLEPERFERQFAVWDRRTDSGRM